MSIDSSQARQAAAEFAFETYVRPKVVANLNVSDLIAAMAAADEWLDDNAQSFNQALPVPFRTTATLQQKAALLIYLARKRAGL